ncbi:hypothetical protein [Sulfurimonas sp.]
MNRVFVHSNNLCGDYENRVLFSPNIELDKYISQDLLVEIEQENPDVIFIKDALSEQYIDLLGLRVAMHIRLSDTKLKFLPIVILSELSLYALVKLSPLAKILFTKNVFLVDNTKEAIDNFDTSNISPFVEDEYKEKFLNLIEIEPPKDYSSSNCSSHDIANQWSIYKWATALSVQSENIKKNKEKIQNMLYFKYLVAKDNIDIYDEEKLKAKFKNGGKIVSIDDELTNGWGDIFKRVFKYQKAITYKRFNYDFKDKSFWSLQRNVVQFIQDEDPDIVLLDLRLLKEDCEGKIDIEDISGIKLLKEIHKINAGIQVLMFTATGKSVILEKLYEYNILGYIKKEHPDDIAITTKENIEKFVSLVEKGFENSYLKTIWNTQQEILSLELFKNPQFDSNMTDEYYKLWELRINISMVFDTLESGLSKKFVYAMFSIYKCIETICDYYIYEVKDRTKNNYVAYWKGSKNKITNDWASTENKTINILKKFNVYDTRTENTLKQLVCSRNYTIHPKEKKPCQNYTIENPVSGQIVEWFKFLSTIVQNMKI